MKKQLLTALLTVALTGSAFAADIVVRGNVAEVNSITASAAAGNTTISNLGDNTNYVNFGTLQIVSNDTHGFDLSLTSSNDGELVLTGKNIGNAAATEKVPYEINLKNTAVSGSLGANLIEDTDINAVLDIAADGDNDIPLEFTVADPGSAPAAPTNITYTVDVRADDVDILSQGNFVDTVTVTIAGRS